MNTFKAGPPGGKTIPPTSIKLSDLAGGVYGPGASVASTGLNSQRSVVKAASSHAAGDTWEDVLEYYLVRVGVIAKVVPMTRTPLVQRRQRRN
jgi:SEL1 protein